MFDFVEADFGSRQPPAKYEYTCFDSPPKRHKKSGVKVRNRDNRRQAAADLADLDSAEARALEAQLGVAPRVLPPHLRSYALQRRNAACFSGPGILPGEQEVGHIEYKLRLLDPTPTRFQQLVTQLNWRLSEGGGECLYVLGVEDNGHPRGLDGGDLRASLEVLQAMAAEVGAEAEVLQTPPGSAEGRRCAVVRVVRTAAPALNCVDLRVAVAGGVDSGKSTLVGVLSHGAAGAPLLDNGRGSSRMRVFRHKHECESGHTSSVSLQQCCYDAAGCVLNYTGLSSLTPAEVAASAARMLRFLDMGGHERFSKTLLHGLTAMLPDYVLLCVSAVAGVSWATREHLAVALALGVPLLVTITKTDMASEAAVAEVADDIRSLLAAAVRQGGGPLVDPASLAPMVQSEAQAVQLAARMHRSRIVAPGDSLCVPLFLTSAVTGASLQLLHAFFNALPPPSTSGGGGGAAVVDGMQGWRVQQQGEQKQEKQLQRQLQQRGGAAEAGNISSSLSLLGSQQAQQEPTHFQIDGSFDVPDVGTVYSGTVVSGSIGIGQQLLLGPLDGGAFRRVAVTGIHRFKVDVQAAHQGQHATVAVQPLGGGPSGVEPAAGQNTAAAAATAEGEAAAGIADGEEQQGRVQLPSRADSAGCLHAWMQQSSSSSTSAVAIQCPRGAVLPPSAAAGAPSSSLTAQLSRSQQLAGPLLPPSVLREDSLPRHWGSSPQLAAVPTSSAPAPRPRKGAVLLDPSLSPTACTQFEAVLVLMGGHWPARGLLSGCYPPEGEQDEPDPNLAPSGGSFDLSLVTAVSHGGDGLAGGSVGAQRPHSLGSGRLHRAASRRRLAAYIPVIHCGSIRQAAQVLAMRELPLPLHWGGNLDGGGGHSGNNSDSGNNNSSSSSGSSSVPERAGSCEEVDPGCGFEVDELLLALDLLAEPSARSDHAVHAQHAMHRDPRQLAGAVAAAGVLLPCALPRPAFDGARSGAGGSGGSTGAHGTSSASGAGSSGAGSGAGTPVTPAATPVLASSTGGGSVSISPAGIHLAAALERQRSFLPSEDVGCLAAVTFSFMHQPEWLVEGARLIVRDRTTGRTAGAGYIAAVRKAAPEAWQ